MRLKSNWFIHCIEGERSNNLVYHIKYDGNGFVVTWDAAHGSRYSGRGCWQEEAVERLFKSGTWVFSDEQGNRLSEVPTAQSSSADTPVSDEHDVVAKPRHYDVVPGYEVKDINKAILDSMEAEGFDITLYEAGWWQQAMQYLMRAHKKNGLEDFKKGIQTMQFVVDSMEKRHAELSGKAS